MNIDIHTLAVVLSLTNVLQVIALFVQYRVNKTHRGLGWWALGSASGALGFAFNYLRDAPTPLGPIAIVANAALFVFSMSLFYVGVLRFLDQRERRGRLIAFCAVITLLAIYFTYLNDNLAVRRVNISVAIAAISFLIARGLFVHRTRSVTASAYFLAVVFLANGGFFTVRALATLTGDPVNGAFTPTLTQTAMYLVTLIASTLWTFGFIILVNQRLNVENRETKENLELIFNTSPDAVLITRLHDGYLVNINDGFTALTGFTRAEVIGKSSLDINIWKNPADRQKVVTALDEKGFCENLEAVFQRKDGSQLNGMISAKNVALQGVPHIISVTRDITERKKAEEAQRESEEKFAMVFRDAPVWIAITDMNDATYLDVNEQALRVTGFSREEAIGHTAVEIGWIKGDDRARLVQEIQDHGRIAGLEMVFHAKDGRPLHGWVNGEQMVIGGRLCLLTVTVDITERKRAEEARRESENRLQNLFETMAEGVILITPDGQIVQANLAAERILGISRPEIESRNYISPNWAILRPDGTPMPPEEMAGPRAMQEKRPIKDTVMGVRRPDGSVSWINVCAAPLLNSAGELEGVVGTFADITDRKRAEEARRESERRYRLLAENATDVIWTVDMAMRATYFSPSVTRLLGFSVQEAMSRTMPEAYTPASLDRAVQAMQEELAIEQSGAGAPNRARLLELDLNRKDGSTVPVEANFSFLRDAAGRPVGILAIARDITERKRAEEALRQERILLRTVIDNLPDAIYVKDATGRKTLTNRADLEYVGAASEAEVLGKTDWEVFPQDVAARFDADDQAVLQSGQPVLNREELLANVHGQRYRLLTSKLPLRDESGRIVGIVGIGRDITERVRVEEALRRRAEELAALQVTLLEITAPHDLPTLLRTIVERAAQLLGARGGGMYVCDPGRREARCVVSYNTPHDYTGTILEYGEGAAGTVAQTGEPLIIDDYRVWGKRAAVYEEKQPFTTVLSAPMIWQDQVTGVIHVLDDVESRHFTETDLALLTLFANHAAIAVENARLYEEAQNEITERKRAEEALRESEVRYRELFENINSGVAVYTVIGNGQDFIFKDFNRAGERIDHDRRERLIGKSIFEVRPGVEQFGLIEVFRQVWQTGEPAYHPVTLYLDEKLSGWYENFVYKLPSGEIVAVFENITERKRAEEALRESEEWFRTLADTTSTGILIYQGERLVYVNRANRMLSGYTAEEFLALRFWDLIHPDYRELVRERGLARQRGEPVPDRYEVKIVRKDGEARWIDFTAGRINWKGQPAVLGTAFDITERRQAEEALRESAERFRRLYEQAPLGYQSLDAEGCLIDVNQAWLDLLRYSRDEVIGRWFGDFLAPQEVDLFKQRFPRFKATGEVHVDLEMVQRAGSTIIVHIDGRIGRDEHGQFKQTHCILHDITARKRAEEALQESEARLKEAQALGRIGNWEFDLDNRTIQWSDQVYRLYERDPAMGPPNTEEEAAYYSPEQAERLHEYARNAAQQGRAYEYDLDIRLPGGRIVHAAATMRPIKDKSGRIVKLFGTVQDITERKRAEEALRELNAVLEQRVEERTQELSLANLDLVRAVRLRDEFLANMSHELRTPLNGILGLSESLQEGTYGPLTPKQMHSLQTIESSGQRLLALVRDILDFAKIGAGKLDVRMGPISVKSVCQASLRYAEQIAQKKWITLTSQLDEQVSVLEADQRRLKQILVNLLANAVKFTPEGGAVGLEVVGDVERGEVRFTVWDTGIGIAQEDIARLFQPFTQLDTGLARSYEGAGLGLALVARLVELHGGRVWVESELGHGSRFIVALPWQAAGQETRASGPVDPE